MGAGYKITFFLLLVLLAETTNAQCPVTVQINQTPANPICKDTEVTFSATISAGAITSYIWVLNEDTVSNDSIISTNTNWSIVEVYAVSDACNNDTVSDRTQILNIDIQAEYEVIAEECNQPVADVRILNISGGQAPYFYNLYTDEGDIGEQTTYTDIPVSAYPLVVTDANQCQDTTWVNMAVVECPEPIPSDRFTPNEDGYNDTWMIQNISLYPNNEVFVYDRWGQRVYHKKGYTNQDGWDAKYIGTNMPVSAYYYILKINFEKQDEKVYRGAVSIFR